MIGIGNIIQLAGSGGGSNPGLQSQVDALESDVINLENNEFKYLYWASVSASSGTISKPTGTTIILGEINGFDSLAETISSGKPTGSSPVTSGGSPVIVSSFDIAGNYVLSGVPSAFPVAVLFVLLVKGKDISNLSISQIIADDISIINNLTDTSTNKALSAAQGKFLKETTDTLNSAKADKINNTQNTSILFWDNGIGEDLGGFYYDKTNKILNLKGTLPTLRVMNNDGSYLKLDRTQTANNFKLKNYVLQAGGIGKAISFNGSTQYGTAGGASIYSSSTSAFSFSLWVKFPSAQSFAQGVITVGNVSITVQGTAGSFVNVGVLSNLGAQYDNLNLLDNAWHHVCLVNGSSSYQLYVDGVQRLTQGGVVSTSNGTITLSNNNAGSGRALFQADQIIIWNVKLTVGEVVTLYNSGSGTASPPQTGSQLKRRYEIEEGTGSTIIDTSGNIDNLTLFNSPVWLNVGKVPVSGTAVESILIESSDGLSNGERGVHKFGEFNGTSILQGRYIRMLIDIYSFFVTDLFGNVLIDSANTGSGTPTAKLTIGAPTALLAGFRFIAGVLNTAAINLGDFNHNLSQRTYFRRKGASTANSIWISEVGVMFTATNQITVANTITASTLLGTAVTGLTKTFPSDFFVIGKMAEIEINGIIGITSTDQITIDTTLGGTNISTAITSAIGAALTNASFSLKITIKCESVGASGTMSVTGACLICSSFNTPLQLTLTKVGTTTINTTIAQILDVKSTWSAASASNTITAYNSCIKIIN